jgi:predicted transcriptional regulator
VFFLANRDRLSIIAAILQAVNCGSSKTRIMFSANLSFNLLEKYLDICLRAGFVQANGSKYTLTEHGASILKQYKQLHMRYSNVQKTFNNLVLERKRLAQGCLKSTIVSEKNGC